MKTVFRTAALVAVAFFLAGQAQATITPYYNRAAWEAAVGSFFEEHFDDSTLEPWLTIESDCVNAGCQPGASGGLYNDRVGTEDAYETFWEFSFPAIGAGAFFDTSPQGPGVSINIYALGSLVETIPGSFSPFGFFGFTSDVLFDTVSLQAGGSPGQETYNIDDLVAAPVPEPGTLALLGLGLAGLRLFRRRREE